MKHPKIDPQHTKPHRSRRWSNRETSRSDRERDAPRREHGFTIIETLLAIGIISILLSIGLPVLMGARTQTLELQSLANARTAASDMQAYADAFGTWPFAKAGQGPPGFPADLMVVPTWPPGSFIGTSDHWALSRLWAGVVSVVAPWETHFDAWVSPGTTDSALGSPDQNGITVTPRVSYLYSNSFVASPALWSGSAAADPSLIAPTRPADVAHPANKVLVWDGELAYLPKRPAVVQGQFNHLTPMAFADGHGAIHTPLDATPGVENPLSGASGRLHNTPNGVLGRDY